MFVNHAFGNYRDLMKEFSFNVIMGGWLSFKSNKSLQYNIEDQGKVNYPDVSVVQTCFGTQSTLLFSHSHAL